MTREWDAATYDRIADPQTRWGGAVVEELQLEGDEVVLDAGCGSGRVTELLAGRLPQGRIIGLDASPAMLEQARRRLERFGHRVELVAADLLRPLPLAAPVDLVLSTATFHWVPDHDALFRHLAVALRPSGRLVAQCGGAGNLATVVAALAEIGADSFRTKVFATPGETTARLEAAGFVEVECWLHPEPTPFEDLDSLATFLRTVALREHVARMDPNDAHEFSRSVASRMPRLELDYVRLNLRARRPAG